MNLEDLKTAWKSSDQRYSQTFETNKMIDMVVQQKYISKINKIAYPELIGVVVCLAGATFIGVNIFRLQTHMLQAVGISSIIVLLMISVISLLSIHNLHTAVNTQQSYAETLKVFARQNRKFFKLQKLNVMLNYLLVVLIIILILKFYGGTAISKTNYFWTYAFSFGYLLLFFCSRRVSKFYKKSLQQAGELLEESMREN